MCRYAVITALFSWFCNNPAVAQNQLVYFGNLHSHTSYSDGSGTPDDAYRHARNTAGLDFLAVTEHNHRWSEGFAAADRRDGRAETQKAGLREGEPRLFYTNLLLVRTCGEKAEFGTLTSGHERYYAWKDIWPPPEEDGSPGYYLPLGVERARLGL